MGTEIAFTVSKIPLNGYAVHSTERLTKKDHKPVNEANNMGLHVTTNNCKSEVEKDCVNGQFVKQAC